MIIAKESSMKRIIPLLLVLVFLAGSGLADPLVLIDDYAADISEPYDESDPSAGTFVYSCHYPHVDEDAEGGMEINAFYSELLDYELGFTMPMIQDAFEGFDTSTVISYTVTCNNDEYFSVLIKKEEVTPDRSRTSWTGHVFSRKSGKAGYTFTLPMLLGILESTENEEWIQNYQTEKADSLIREMVWDMVEESRDTVDYGDLTRESLENVFFPEENFYLDKNGDPVFYIQPGDLFDEVPEGTGLLVFPIPVEDILDEL